MTEEKKATHLTPNEVHLYWQEICRSEDFSRTNAASSAHKADIFNADPQKKKANQNNPQLKQIRNDMGRLLVVPTHATAAHGSGDPREEAEQRERMKNFALRGIKNLRSGPSSPVKQAPQSGKLRGNQSMSPESKLDKSMSRGKQKLADMQKKVEYEKQRRQQAEQELKKLKITK